MSDSREMVTEQGFATLAWGDRFILSDGSEHDGEYTVLVVYPLNDQPGFNVVCLQGVHDPGTMAPNAGDEIYLRVAPIGGTLRVIRRLHPRERTEAENAFYTFMVFLGATRVTTAVQPVRANEKEWTVHVAGKNLLCTKAMRVGYGDCGECTADVFMGSELQGDVVMAVYLVFVELVEEDPDTYAAVDKDTQEMLYEHVMESMGYGVLAEDDIDTES